MSGKYDHIINLPHHVSATRPQMPIRNRAAQFASFKALTGHEEAVKETARLTTERIELGESQLSALDMKQRILYDNIADHPQITVTHFQEDEKKEGGAYIKVSGAVKKIDDFEGVIVLMNGVKIAIQDTLEIESELFRAFMQY